MPSRPSTSLRTAEPMSETPDPHETPHETTETSVFDSDPHPDGDMGVSSERTGTVRGQDEPATYGAAQTHTDPEEDGAPTGADVPPEQSSPDGTEDGRPEVQPDNDVSQHEHDRTRNPGSL